MAETARVDAWLFAVRLAKTRSRAGAACRGGHVTVNGTAAKPATQVTVGDRIEVRVGNRDRIVEVVRPIVRRVGAPEAVTCYVDHSPPPPERDTAVYAVRDPGTGRPTKRDRRQLDRLRGRTGDR